MQDFRFLQYANIDKATVTPAVLSEFLALAASSPRVVSIELADGGATFNVVSDELEGEYSMGRIAGMLLESSADRAARCAITKPDIINITKFSKGQTFATRDALRKHAQTLSPSTERAQCYTIANYAFLDGESIADRFLRDHIHAGNAIRHARILVDCGRANECGEHGTVTFEDGSTL